MSKIIAPTFGAVAASIARTTSARRDLIAAEVSDALTYIGAKSGQDRPLRDALKIVETNAPRGKNGKVSPAASRLLASIGNAMTAGKLAFSRLQTANKLSDAAKEDFAAECAAIVEQFRVEAWPAKQESAPKVPATPLDKARAAIAALSESERTALIAELTGMPAVAVAEEKAA